MTDIIQNWIDQKVNRNTKEVYWKQQNNHIICDDKNLYSYGRHFILGIYLGIKNGKPLFMVNGDKWSISTSGHTSQVINKLSSNKYEYFIVSFSALEMVTSVHKIKVSSVIDTSRMNMTKLIYDKEVGKYYKYEWNLSNDELAKLSEDYLYKLEDFKIDTQEFIPPNQGMFLSSRNIVIDVNIKLRDNSEIRRYSVGNWHLIDSVLLKVVLPNSNSDEYTNLLCSIDEGSYFVSDLGRDDINSIEEAFEVLRPDEVRQAINEGKKVLRQGEWFFVEIGHYTINKFKKNKFIKQDLPQNNPTSNRHNGKIYIKDNHIFAMGNIRHLLATQTRDISSGEHKMLRLTKDYVYEVYKNTERTSYNSHQKVD